MDISSLFTLRSHLNRRDKTIIELVGLVVLLIVWETIPSLGLIPTAILPPPSSLITAAQELFTQDRLVNNLAYSIQLNLLGYIEATSVAIPLGFAIGIIPLFRALMEKPIVAMRFLPLTAMTGIFIAWFGIETNMKVQFLAFGIFIYLLPVVVKRVDETKDVYIQCVQTLGASQWQTISSVFIPDVCSRVFDDVRVLVAISWTYIIIAEVINMSDGGIGALAYTAARQSRIDKVYAILFIIIFVGFIQDMIFKYLDRILFPHKYV